MCKELTIQAIRGNQAALLLELHSKSFGDKAWTFEQIEKSLSLETTTGLIAKEDDQPAGFILLQSTGEESEILTFCVAPESQRQNIGLALLTAAIDDMRVREAKKIYLEVAADNNAAYQLYHKVGFQMSGRRKDYYKVNDRLVDALQFELTL